MRKMIIVKKIKVGKEFVGFEGDFAMSPLTYREGDALYKYVVENVEFDEVDDNIENAEVVYGKDLIVFIPFDILEKAKISKEDVFDFVFSTLFARVEVRDKVGNVIGIEYVLKDEIEKREDIKGFYPVYYREVEAEVENDVENEKVENDVEDEKIIEIANKLKNKKVLIDSKDIEDFNFLFGELSFVSAETFKKISPILENFIYARGADGTEFYYKRGSKLIELPKDKIKNVGKFIGKGGVNIKELQKEIECRIKLI
jgi:hypothetical protein